MGSKELCSLNYYRGKILRAKEQTPCGECYQSPCGGKLPSPLRKKVVGSSRQGAPSPPRGLTVATFLSPHPAAGGPSPTRVGRTMLPLRAHCCHNSYDPPRGVRTMPSLRRTDYAPTAGALSPHSFPHAPRHTAAESGLHPTLRAHCCHNSYAPPRGRRTMPHSRQTVIVPSPWRTAAIFLSPHPAAGGPSPTRVGRAGRRNFRRTMGCRCGDFRFGEFCRENYKNTRRKYAT